LVIGGESNIVSLAGRSFDTFLFLACHHVPELDPLVPGAR